MIANCIEWVTFVLHTFKAIHLFAWRQITHPDCPSCLDETKVYVLSHLGSHTCACSPPTPCNSFYRKAAVLKPAGWWESLSSLGSIFTQLSRQAVPRDQAQASLRNLQQITIIPTHASLILTNFLWFLVMIREWSCLPWFMVMARWHCGFVMSI